MTNEPLRSPIDGRFTAGRCGPVDHHLPRPAIRAAGGSAGNSIARCDDRTHNRQLEDSDAVVADRAADHDADAEAAIAAALHNDAYAILRFTRAGRGSVLSVVTDADGNSATYLDTDPATGAVLDPPERWALASHLLLGGDAGNGG